MKLICETPEEELTKQGRGLMAKLEGMGIDIEYAKNEDDEKNKEDN